MNYLFSKQNKRGFTLIESMVAITIFTVSILSMMSLLAKGLSDTNFVKRKMVATYLAQEGIEYIRNMVNTSTLYYNVDKSVGWNNTWNNASLMTVAKCATANGCYFDPQGVSYTDPNYPILSTTFTACSDSAGKCGDHPIYFHPSTGKYDYISAGGQLSGFSRKIFLQYAGADELRFASAVYWTQGSGAYNIVLWENLTKWIE
jgi:prepilin-type N-terminal cleavage/methylation domain-containing protein